MIRGETDQTSNSDEASPSPESKVSPLFGSFVAFLIGNAAVGIYFKQIYTLLYRESSLGLFLFLALTGVCNAVVLGFRLRKPMFDSLHRNIRGKLLFKGGLGWRLVRRLLVFVCWPWGLIPISILTFSVLWTFASFSESWFLEFDDSKVKIMVADFAGPDLTGRLGGFGFRQKIEGDIRGRADETLARQLQIVFSNERPRSADEAETLLKRFGADFLVWGFAEQLPDTLTVYVRYSGAKAWKLAAAHPSSDTLFLRTPNLQVLKLSSHTAEFSVELVEMIEFQSLCVLVDAAVVREDCDSGMKYLQAFEEMFGDVDPSNKVFACAVASRLAMVSKRWALAIEKSQCMLDELQDLSMHSDQLKSGIVSTIASCYASLGDTASAISNFETAIRLDPCNTLAQDKLSSVFAGSGDFRGSLQIARQGLACEPKDVRLLGDAGLAYYYLGRLDSARDYLVPAVKIDNSNSALRVFACVVLADYQDFVGLRSLLESISKDPIGLPDRLWAYYIISLVELDQLEEAEVLSKRLLESDPCAELALDLVRQRASLRKGPKGSRGSIVRSKTNNPVEMERCDSSFEAIGISFE